MNRRKVLTGAAGIGAATVGLAAFAGGAAAELEDYEISGGTISGESDDGSLAAVTAEAANVEFGYTGLENNAEFAVVLFSAGNESDSILDYAAVGDLSGTTENGIAIETVLNGDLAALTDYETADFEADSDGAVTDVTVGTRVDVVVFSNTDDAVDLSTVEGYVNAGDSLQDGLDQLAANEQYYDYVQDTRTASLQVEMTNVESNSATGGEVGGEIVTE